ncbi:hypothetical protein LB553_29975 [Mesorhizobium sp. CA8]|uniref:hypothetical protein n=1 Tax=unclassified Mesorhizobium TaxID=325217 RepID=UPI001CCFB344|nr:MULTISPECIES: hypothetical protein [unclassified Mesorhizobium]MBZ9765059.1 hypothetical protein [Mesorhizobium sp. CA8]MBZ9823479.1 hypothetical protein [Mesorhizobium sp. CA4]
MNRNRRNSFGRKLTCASTSSVPSTADASLLAARPNSSTGEDGATGQEQTKDRMEALGFIVCRLDELRQMAASHGLETLGCLLDAAFTQSCDEIRRERSYAQSEETHAIGGEDDRARDTQVAQDCKPFWRKRNA